MQEGPAGVCARALVRGARFPPPTRAAVLSADAFTNLRGKMGTTATFRSEMRTQITVMAIFFWFETEHR